MPLQRAPIGAPVDVRVRLQWYDAGTVRLDARGKPAFGDIERAPGLYRLTLTGGGIGVRARVYIGETDDLRRRLSRNYRNPDPSQKTNVRINVLLREHLGAGGTVTLAVATVATVWLGGAEQPLNLTHSAVRLLAENTALVLAQSADDVDIMNLG